MKKYLTFENIKLLMAIIYIVSPIDIIPEIFLGILGLTDDGLVLIYIVTIFIKKLRKHL